MPERKCTGECIKCSFHQQVYCAAQYGYAIMSYMPAIVERLGKIEDELSKFGTGTVINPFEDNKAQGESGADNRDSIS